MAIWAWILIIVAILAVAVLAVLAVLGARRRRMAALRQRFGAEYDRMVAAGKNPRAAEAELLGRQRERRKLDIKPLSEESRARYAGEWRGVQEYFVDQPIAATDAADNLICRVMQERGYPVKDFDAQSALVSVDYPGVVEDYRAAHDIQQKAQSQRVSTEDLREALVRYRSLFEELVRADGVRDADGVQDATEPRDSRAEPDDAGASEPDDTGADARTGASADARATR